MKWINYEAIARKLDEKIEKTEERLKGARSELADVNARLGRYVADHQEWIDLKARRTALYDRIKRLTRRLSELERQPVEEETGASLEW